MITMNGGVRYLRVGIIVFVLSIIYLHLLLPSHQRFWTSFRENSNWDESLDSSVTLLDYPDQHPFNLPVRAEFGHKQIDYLPKSLVPSRSEKDAKKQLVIIGDVHGAYAELEALKTKLEKHYPAEQRHYVFVGDMVTKGPQSLEVVNWARRMNASCVRGNQEDRLLLMYKDLRSKSHEPNYQPKGDDDMWGLKVNKKLLPQAKRKNSELAKLLQPQQAEYLESCPLVLRAEGVAGIGDLAVVHAGVIAGVPFEQTDPFMLMNMKSIDSVSHLPSEENDGIHWTTYWNHYVRKTMLKKGKKPTTIVYGHNAARGLEIQQYTKGIDSNCVHGGRLSALAIQGGTKPKSLVVSIPCNEYVTK